MRVFFFLAASFVLAVMAPGAAAQSPKAQTQNAATSADQAALQAIADYGALITPVLNQATALMAEMVELSDRYLLGFTDPDAYAQEKASIDDALSAFDDRIAALRRDAASIGEPPAGPYQARGAELKAYAEKFVLEVADMKAALDRLPGLVAGGDAEGFDAARAVLFRSTANAIRAENAFLLISQLSAPYSHPEYHLIEAIKNGNVVVADILDLLQRINAGETDYLDVAAARIADYHRAIGISIDAGEAVAGKLRATMLSQNPSLKREIEAFFDAYQAAFRIERRIADGISDYVPIAKELADGADPQSLAPRLDAIGQALSAVFDERQAALQAKQNAAIALVGKAR